MLKIVTGVIVDPTTDCDLPLDLRGTPYEMSVWLMLREIPAAFGATAPITALIASASARPSAHDHSVSIDQASLRMVVSPSEYVSPEAKRTSISPPSSVRHAARPSQTS